MQTCPEGEKNILFKVDSNISSMPVINSMTTTKIIKNNPNRRWKRHKKKKLIKLREGKKGKGMKQKRMRYISTWQI